MTISLTLLIATFPLSLCDAFFIEFDIDDAIARFAYILLKQRHYNKTIMF